MAEPAGAPRGPLDPDVAGLLDAVAGAGRPGIETMTPAEARRRFAQDLAALVPPAPVPAVAELDLTVPGDPPVPVRLFRPAATGPAATVVWCHGGGWVLGDAAASTGDCRSLAASTGAVVVAVGYRLAPEHPFPAALADVATVLDWAAARAGELGGDPARLAVGGDSAGGNLAAVTARRAAAAGRALGAQLLVYPATDLRLGQPSVAVNGDGFLLTAAALAWFVGHYLAGADPAHPDASPLLADGLAGLAPALVVTAGYDPLADDGAAYAQRLEAAGVPVTRAHFPGLVHGFTALAGLSPGAAAATEAVWAAAAGLLDPAGAQRPPGASPGRGATVQPACDTERGS